MNTKRVLMANKLTSYRQTIALALRELRPEVEFVEADSEALNQQVLQLSPDLVICSRATPLVRASVPNWIELHPDHQPFSTVCIAGERQTVDDLQLTDLLFVVDSVEVSPDSGPGYGENQPRPSGSGLPH